MRVRRRPTVWLAALLALLVGMALLPNAGAAESASERLGADGTREFAGADRYETAVLLAQAVVNARPVGSAIVASGESLVDATAAASLAAVQSSVVLLTRPDHLPTSVAAFIEAAGLSEVTIVGGPTAVSVGVEAQLDAVSGVNSVSRVSGVDRYATSAAIAAQSEVPGAFCRIERSVFLVGGSSLVDAIAAGPYAYAMGMPILFTEAGGLPPAVSSYLRDAGIQRAVVVGDLDAVSTAVDGQLREAGIVHPWRIDGPDAPTRAVDLLKAVATCSETTISPDTVALVDGTVPIDGTTAAALLGTGLGVPNTVVPALVITEPLPESVRYYLAPNRPEGEGPLYQHLNILPLGGTARLTPEILAMAIRSSMIPRDPAATIVQYFPYPPIADHGYSPCITNPNRFLITFSVDVNWRDAIDARNYTANGQPLGQTFPTLLAGEPVGSMSQVSTRSYLLDVRYEGLRAGNVRTVGIRAHGIRDLTGKSLPYHQMTTFEPPPSVRRPTADDQQVLATINDKGDRITITLLGGSDRSDGYYRWLEPSKAAVVSNGKSYPLADSDQFYLDEICIERDSFEEYKVYDSYGQPEIRFSSKDHLYLDEGAIVSGNGTPSEAMTIPLEIRPDNTYTSRAFGTATTTSPADERQLQTIGASVKPVAIFPPLRPPSNLTCVNSPNTWVVTFDDPVDEGEALTASSYRLEVAGEPVSIEPWAEIHLISDTQILIRIRKLRAPATFGIQPNTIHGLEGGFANMEPVLLEPWGKPAPPRGPAQVYAFVHNEGQMLTYLWTGMNLSGGEREFWRSSSKVYDSLSDPLGKPELVSDALESFNHCTYWTDIDEGDGYIGYRIPDGLSQRFAVGDELTFSEGFFSFGGFEPTPAPTMTATVQSWEDLQLALP